MPEEVAFTGSSIEINDSYDLTSLALELYKVTGIITPGENPDYIKHSGYNSLGAMLYVLGQFGLQCKVVIRDDETNRYLRKVFPVEFQLMENLQVPVSILDMEESTPNKTMLISVISVEDSLHYILNSAQGEWFDSGVDGVTNSKWAFIENWQSSNDKREGASWLGISIQISY
ncbi:MULTISPECIES: hypothetical protein [Vibrio]|uniref:hypothetical protein n=1 Tax=Vibrio TaxID=662 RepID=UPI001E3E9A6F|nr:hypothetical protein [Vibrio natriegens]MEE3878081.1 hypothetical protein [Vibrio sp. YYF0003]